MHASFFGLKRAWHGTLRTFRRAFTTLGLTAARFDMLYALRWTDKHTSLSQRLLRRALGVNRTTVSRMLASLEALGLVTRTQDPWDRRTRAVRLTDQGRHRLRIAMRDLIETGNAQLAVDSAIAGAPSGKAGKSFHDKRACFESTEALETLLGAIRFASGDLTSLHYPWHPDVF